MNKRSSACANIDTKLDILSLVVSRTEADPESHHTKMKHTKLDILSIVVSRTEAEPESHHTKMKQEIVEGNSYIEFFSLT